jgi:putative MATE family efflux protein
MTDLTQGSVSRQLIQFTLPLILANTLQVCFNLVDMFFVGKFAGTDALSAVSIGGQITGLMFSFFLGVATSSQIYVAQAVGAHRRKELNSIIGNALTLSVIAGAVLMVVIPLARPILRLVQTPESILDDTVTYLVICCYINILVSLYNGLCGVLRGMGDSTRPTIFVVAATVVNIVLDYLFVGVFQWGSAGAAWATLIGQTTAFVVALAYLYRHRASFGFDFKLASFRPMRRHMEVLLRIGVPVVAKSLFINLSMLFVNALINSMGVVAVAVTGICQKLQNMMSIMSQAMNDGTASLVGQNMGRGKLDRVERTVWIALAMGFVYALVLAALFLFFPRQIFGIFSSDEAVLALSRSFMAVCALSVVSFSIMSPTMGLINGVGFTMLNMIIAVADGVVARIALSLLLGYSLGMGALGFFLGNSLAGFVSVIGGMAYFLSGRWRKRTALIDGPAEQRQNG